MPDLPPKQVPMRVYCCEKLQRAVRARSDNNFMKLLCLESALDRLKSHLN
jgi:hypothetical protein